MKSSAILLAFLFFILAAFTARGDSPIDTEGYPLDKQSSYYIEPTGDQHKGKAIVVTEVKKNRTICGLYLSLASESKAALPIKLSTQEVAISTYSPLNISFVGDVPNSGCAISSQATWVIGLGLPPPPYVRVGDPQETDNVIYSGAFHINPAEGYDESNANYVLSFCDKQEVDCATVGVQTDGRLILLTEGQEDSLALKFRFRHTPAPPPPSPSPPPPSPSPPPPSPSPPPPSPSPPPPSPSPPPPSPSPPPPSPSPPPPSPSPPPPSPSPPPPSPSPPPPSPSPPPPSPSPPPPSPSPPPPSPSPPTPRPSPFPEPSSAVRKLVMDF